MSDALYHTTYTGYAHQMTRDGLTLGGLIKIWHFRWKSRRQLETMTDEQLADIGLTHTEMLVEAVKPFWVK